MKCLAIMGQILGFISSLFLAYGFAPPKGTFTWTQGDGSEYDRNAAVRGVLKLAGFALLAASFLAGIIVTAASPN